LQHSQGSAVADKPARCAASHHYHHIFDYSLVVTRNLSHRVKNTQSLKTVHKQYK